MSELGGERIDIIEWSEDQAAYIKESLSPATALDITLNEDEHRAVVTVAEDQQSLAIGRGGQNVRLAAKLTGWNIDINSVGGAHTEAEASEAEPMGVGDAEVAAAEAEDMDPAVAAGIDPTETESVITEEEPESSALPAEEELTMAEESSDSIVDEEEARDVA
jgi:N utilization substance protein A